MGSSVVQQRTNFVTEVAIQAGISLGNTAGTLTKPGSIAEYANNAAGNFGKIAEIGMHAANLAEQQQSSSTIDLSQLGSSSWTRAAMGMVGIAALGAVAPAAGAVAGVVMAVGEAVNFSVGHAAVNGAKGELTMAASTATFDEKGDMTSYTSACDGVTADVKTGQPVMAPAATPFGAGLTPQQRLGNLVGQVAGDYDAEQIQRDVNTMLGKEKQKFSWAQNKLDMMGLLDPDSKKSLDLPDAELILKAEAPRPRALNVGMGAPSFG